jgi:hypothetical protein
MLLDKIIPAFVIEQCSANLGILVSYLDNRQSPHQSASVQKLAESATLAQNRCREIAQVRMTGVLLETALCSFGPVQTSGGSAGQFPEWPIPGPAREFRARHDGFRQEVRPNRANVLPNMDLVLRVPSARPWNPAKLDIERV